MTLAEFYAARLDEDEAAAKAAAKFASWSDNPWYSGEIHIARHSPARVLREVEAGRKILAMHNPMGEPRDYDQHDPPCAACDVEESWPCSTIKALAAVWSDHPDYDPAWAD